MTPLRLISVSDLHLGNTRVEPERLAQNIRNYLLPQFSSIELLCIDGDFFDTALSLTDTVTASVLSVMYDILSTANQHDITVRILRGTFSHERTQGRYFPLLHTQYAFTNDLRYFDTIALEYLPRFDLRMLYLPDDLPYPSSDAIMAVVEQKCHELGWDYVDYVLAHGYFDHVVPVGALAPKITYRCSQFNFVRRKVLIGHVHTPSITDDGRFIYNGSFDRLAHGEEEPKGFMRIDDDGTTAKVQFIENRDATRFVTLDYSQASDEALLLQHFQRAIDTYPKDRLTNVRVIQANPLWRHALSKLCKQQYPHIRLSDKAPAERQNQADMVEQTIIDLHSLRAPTEENLPALIVEHGDLGNKPSTLTEDRIRDLLGSLTS